MNTIACPCCNQGGIAHYTPSHMQYTIIEEVSSISQVSLCQLLLLNRIPATDLHSRLCITL